MNIICQTPALRAIVARHSKGLDHKTEVSRAFIKQTTNHEDQQRKFASTLGTIPKALSSPGNTLAELSNNQT
ncbi:unnamed protein product [Acidithrix sp. C25]|nr:unnamed protein product [Acidithrix sp. C25]